MVGRLPVAWRARRPRLAVKANAAPKTTVALPSAHRQTWRVTRRVTRQQVGPK